MFDWLASWFAQHWASITSLAQGVRDALKQAMDTLVALFIRWALGFAYVVYSAYLLYVAGFKFLAALHDRFWFLIYITLPNAIFNAANQAITYARGWINILWDRVTYYYQLAKAEYTQLVRNAIDYARTWVNYLYGWLSTVDRLLTAVAQRVAQLLTDPRALADWIAGHIVQAVFRWALGNAEALSRLAFQFAITGAIRFAAIAEQILTDLFL